MLQHMQARPGRSQVAELKSAPSALPDASYPCSLQILTHVQKCRNAEMQMCASST
jgi:hypothetical protein